MKRIVLISLLSSIFAVTYAQADSFTDFARVKSVVPQYDRVNAPRKECTTEVINETRRVPAGNGERNYGGAVVGGIAGALLGNQVGGGHGREAATAAGAVIGALSGDNIANKDSNRVERYEESPREVQRCRTVESWQQRLTGYQVTYEYHGQRYSTLMNSDPGSQIRVRVSVEPD